MALTFFNIRKSIFGRQLGITSTGGLAMAVPTTKATLSGSSDVSLVAQMWGPGMFQAIGAGATTTRVVNFGITHFTNSSAAALYTMDAPVKGVEKKVIADTSSTLITLNTTATTILFFCSTTSFAGSTALVFGTSDGGHNGVYMVGLSTLRWEVISKTAGVTT